MEFFQGFGIDVRLLLSQVVNFAILLWFLTKFLYKPIIERIEKNEKKLEHARKAEEVLQKEKDEFLARKNEEIRSAKRRAKEVIEEAEAVATSIKERVEQEVYEEKKVIIAQYKEVWEAEKRTIKENVKKEFFEHSIESMAQKLALLVTDDVQVSMNGMFLDKLIKEIEGLSHEFTSIASSQPVLEYVIPMTRDQKIRLDSVIEEKLGKGIRVKKKKNPKLIAGFRFDIGGVRILSNLLQEVSHAIEHE